MGGSSSTTTVKKRDPESEELKSLQAGIYNLLAPIVGIDSGSANNAYQSTVNNAVQSGVLPSASTQLKMDDRGRYYYEREPREIGWRSDDEVPYYDDGRQYVNSKDAAEIYRAQQGLSSGANAPKNNDEWANSYFGRSWLDLRDRIDQANNAYDAALNAAPGLQGNVLNTADRISALSDTAQAALQPNIDRLNMLAKDTEGLGAAEQRALQPNTNAISKNAGLISGLGGQIAKLAESGQTALQPNISNINRLSGKLGDLGDTIAGATANYQTQSNNLNRKIEAVGDRQGDLASTVWDFTESGTIPEEMKRNLMSTVNSELNQNTGSALNDLASRGVMNSSVANRSINNLSNAAADAYAKNYLDAYNAVLGGYGQTNNTLSSQADTYSKAFSNANQAWNDRLNGYQLAGTQYNNAIGGYNTANQNISQGFNNRIGALKDAASTYGTANQNYNLANQNISQGYAARLATNNAAANQYNTANSNISQGYSNRLNGLNSALNGYQQAYSNNQNNMTTMAAMPQTLAESAWAQYQPVYSFWQGLRNSYDNKEDNDTVVKQGK